MAMFSVNCSQLRVGQFTCDLPLINPETQQPFGCSKDNLAPINCVLADGLVCHDSGHNNFTQSIPCVYTNGYSFETTLLLSIFFGMFGADRFYLGYPAIGLLKFSTLGFLFLGQLIDIMLIALQIIGPADGSNYVIKYFGPRQTLFQLDNSTAFITDLNDGIS